MSWPFTLYVCLLFRSWSLDADWSSRCAFECGGERRARTCRRWRCSACRRVAVVVFSGGCVDTRRRVVCMAVGGSCGGWPQARRCLVLGLCVVMLFSFFWWCLPLPPAGRSLESVRPFRVVRHEGSVVCHEGLHLASRLVVYLQETPRRASHSWHVRLGKIYIVLLPATVAAAETTAADAAVCVLYSSAGPDARLHSRLHAQDAPKHPNRSGRTALPEEGQMRVGWSGVPYMYRASISARSRGAPVVHSPDRERGHTDVLVLSVHSRRFDSIGRNRQSVLVLSVHFRRFDSSGRNRQSVATNIVKTIQRLCQ